MKDILDIEKGPRATKKYIAIGVGAVVLALIVFLLVILIRSTLVSTQTGMYAKLEDQTISSNGTTYLVIGMRNPSNDMISGKFEVQADDEEAISISYPMPELLSFKLLPGESIERRLNITGTSKAVRTDYEISVSIIDGNSTVLGSIKTVLSVTRD